MIIIDINDLKNLFKDGDMPTGQDFEDLIDTLNNSYNSATSSRATVDNNALIIASHSVAINNNALIIASHSLSLENIPGAIIEITYSNLLTKISSNELIYGQEYKIIDFKTIYLQFESEVESNSTQGISDGLDTSVEPLIVIANSTSTLNLEARSESFPNDIIHYSPHIHKSGNPGNSKGSIIYRKDTIKNISTNYDWRTVKFRLYEGDGRPWDSEYAFGWEACNRNGEIYMNLLPGIENVNFDPELTLGDKWVLWETASGYYNTPYVRFVCPSKIFGLASVKNYNALSYIDVLTFSDLNDLLVDGTTVGNKKDININIRSSTDLIGGAVFICDNSSWDGGASVYNINIDVLEDSSVVFRVADLLRDVKIENSLVRSVLFSDDTINLKINDAEVDSGIICGAYNLEFIGSSSVFYAASEDGFLYSYSQGISNTKCTLSYARIMGYNVIEGVGQNSFVNIETNSVVGACDGHYVQVYRNLNVSGNSFWRNGDAILFNDTTIFSTSYNGGEFQTNKIISIEYSNLTNSNLILNDLEFIESSTLNGNILYCTGIKVLSYFTLPSNFTFFNVSFSMGSLLGLNVWSSLSLNIQNVIVSKYYNSGVLEKLWYEDVDVNGVTNYIELK